MGDPLRDPRAAELLAADPGTAGRLAATFRTVAGESAATSSGLAAAETEGRWTGRAALALRRAIGALPGRLTRITAAYDIVALAFEGYERMLAEVKPAFERVSAELGEARLRADRLRAIEVAEPVTARVVAASETEVAALQIRAYRLLEEFSDARGLCRAQIEAAGASAPLDRSGTTIVGAAAASWMT